MTAVAGSLIISDHFPVSLPSKPGSRPSILKSEDGRSNHTNLIPRLGFDLSLLRRSAAPFEVLSEMRSVWSKGRDISQVQGKQCLSDGVPSTFKFHARAVDASKSHLVTS